MSTRELQRALQALEGVEAGQVMLSRWARSGVLTPSAGSAPIGSHRGHRYTSDDLLRARVLVRLRKAGVTLPRAVALVAALGDDLPHVVRQRGVELVVSGFRVFVVKTIGGEPPVELPFGQQRLPLSGLVLSEDKLRKLIAA